MTDFLYAVDSDGVATITWDVAGRSMNVLSPAGIGALDALINRALGDGAVRGVIITSGKKDFAGGMDLQVIAQMQSGGAAAIFAGVMRLHALLRKIERGGMDAKSLTGGKPIVAALTGTGL